MTLNNILRHYWGYDVFRPLQESIIHSVFTHRKDTLALLPTGGGKSLCFQVPALAMEGLCLVVSPLIALMKDQVYNLQRRGIGAAALYSGMHPQEIDDTLERCIYGNVKLLYVSPERLESEILLARLPRMKFSFLAVDEAHCISQWGYDFRPAYLKIHELRNKLPQLNILALTASATPQVREDIITYLKLQEPNVFTGGFARSNLSYSAFEEDNKMQKMLQILQNVNGSSVVYVRSRKKTEIIAAQLHEKGVAADFYHAGLSSTQRSQKQDLWLQNTCRVMVSTNAFGMGIDKPDVRTVVHLDLPESLEEYYQEAGRAGRDGKKAYAVLLYDKTDLLRLRESLQKGEPDIEELRRLYQALGNYCRVPLGSGALQNFDFQIFEFCKTYNLKTVNTAAALKLLEQEGYILLSDAVWLPPRFKITCSREALYDFQLRHPRYDVFLKFLMRNYAGVFEDFAAVNEGFIAHHLSYKKEEVKPIFEKLQQYEIGIYIPQKDAPQLTFLTPRLPANDIVISQEKREKRKNIRYKNIIAAINYATTYHLCRSRQLSAYFGEADVPDCGICDVCLQRRNTIKNDEEQQIIAEIKQLLQQGEYSMEAILQYNACKQKDRVITVLRNLYDAQKVVINEREKWTWRKK